DLEWHASSTHEEADIRRKLGPVARKIKVAVDLPGMTRRQPQAFSPRAPDVPLRIVFLSRISPMKNLDYALEVLKRVTVDVRFDIYGPISDEAYWQRCKDMIAQLPPQVMASYRGSVEHDQVPSVLAEYDLFFLPTLGENYGHVICEALAAGTPVLIAETTPWRNLEDLGVGWDLPLGKPEAFAHKIACVAGLPDGEYSKMRTLSASFASQRLTDRNVIEANRRLFN
ncbi:MAG: glycosyltransferase family 4 protein, partial [Brucella intermedia]